MNGFQSAMNTPNGVTYKPFGGETPIGFRSCFDQNPIHRAVFFLHGLSVRSDFVRAFDHGSSPQVTARAFGSVPNWEFKSCV